MMSYPHRTSVIAAFLLLHGFALSAQLPSFPGAEGFGASATGGRGGQVVHVTNLNASGPGSLQAACAMSGPRIVVFDLGGLIDGDIVIEHGDLTIAGETAPGTGITIKGTLWTRYSYDVQNIIVRFLRVRPTDLSGAQGDAIQFSRTSHFILDHVSVSWGSDETVDIYEAQNATLQWCTIEESAPLAGHPDGNYHNYGLINGPNGQNLTIHHTLFAHHRRRSPAVANGPADIRNNVIYNFRDGFLHDNPSNNGGFNVVGNYFRRGPSDDDIFPLAFGDDYGQVLTYYVGDNYLDDPPEVDQIVDDPWADRQLYYGLDYYMDNGVKALAPFPTPSVSTQGVLDAYQRVLAGAGCFPRDVVTTRTISEVQNRTGSWGRHVPPDLMDGLSPSSAPLDSDSDGMPDYWEVPRGLNPAVADHNGDDDTNGYTNIEEYLHFRAAILTGDTLEGPELLIAESSATSGFLQFTFSTELGQAYDIYRSLDLETWSKIAAGITAIDTRTTFVDTASLQSLGGKAHYRAGRTTP